MLRKVYQFFCGVFTHHDLIKVDGTYECQMCFKRTGFFPYDLKPTPAEIERSNREVYEFLLDHEMSLGLGG